jgi:hypothetical protein
MPEQTLEWLRKESRAQRGPGGVGAKLWTLTNESKYPHAAAKPRRGRFIAPIADLSALRDYQIIWLNSIIAPGAGPTCRTLAPRALSSPRSSRHLAGSQKKSQGEKLSSWVTAAIHLPLCDHATA